MNEQYEKGELDTVAYLDQRDEIVRHKTALDVSTTAFQQLWQGEKEQFFQTHPEYRENPILWAALERGFNEVNAGPDVDRKTGSQLLNDARAIADRQVREIQEAASWGVGGDSRHATAGTGDLSYLDRLEGVELERALERLSPEQEERYLRG